MSTVGLRKLGGRVESGIGTRLGWLECWAVCQPWASSNSSVGVLVFLSCCLHVGWHTSLQPPLQPGRMHGLTSQQMLPHRDGFKVRHAPRSMCGKDLFWQRCQWISLFLRWCCGQGSGLVPIVRAKEHGVSMAGPGG